MKSHHRKKISKSDLKVKANSLSEDMRKNVTRIDETGLTYAVYFGWKVHDHLIKK